MLPSARHRSRGTRGARGSAMGPCPRPRPAAARAPHSWASPSRAAGYLSASSFIALLHAIHMATALSAGLPIFHVVFHLALAACWLLVAALTLTCARVHMPLDWRPFAFPMVLMYVWSIETYWSLYKATEGAVRCQRTRASTCSSLAFNQARTGAMVAHVFEGAVRCHLAPPTRLPPALRARDHLDAAAANGHRQRRDLHGLQV